jgi:hypothetical protein
MQEEFYGKRAKLGYERWISVERLCKSAPNWESGNAKRIQDCAAAKTIGDGSNHGRKTAYQTTCGQPQMQTEVCSAS